MPVIIDWDDISLRLFCTVIAGLIIGFDRGGHGRPAGMRTTLLVCLAASIAMIQANLLMNTTGKAPNSFIVLDLMRFPLGILSGIGFIGAGAILRKDNAVVGVTTAATLWFATVMGLCFGGGQLGLGWAALTLGWLTLFALKYIEAAIPQQLRATLTLATSKNGPSDAELRLSITQSGCTILAWGIAYLDHNHSREIRAEIHHRVHRGDSTPPSFIAELAKNAQIEKIEWQPQGVSLPQE